jgi:hypothetical protein
MDGEKRTKITKTGREGMMVVMSQRVTRTMMKGGRESYGW